MSGVIRGDLLFPELSYDIIGACFAAFNKLGSGQKELRYQLAVAQELADRSVRFEREHAVEIKFNGQVVGKHRLDFLVENEVAVEFKVGNRFRLRDFEQLASYLATKNKRLGLLVRFGTNGVISRRILNPNDRLHQP